MPFELYKLNYKYNALEPVIDAKTMEIHHSKHHAGYTNNLNKALENYPNLQSYSIEKLLKNLDSLPEEIRTAVKNNGGGFYNHNLYWQVMEPGGKNRPTGSLLKMMELTFDSFEVFVDLFKQEALGRFGSGWAWLTKDNNNDLEVFATPNQDCPLSMGLIPILCIDVWEHAYYLKYQNRRAEYIDKWMTLVNWDVVSKLFEKL